MDHKYVLNEEDRPLVSSILHQFSRKMSLAADEAFDGEAGTALKRLSTRVRELAQEINPGVYNKGIFQHLRYPREDV